MAPNKTVTINFTKEGLQPPVYLAGSFSNPPWIPLPMQYLTGAHNEHQYYKHVEVEEGKEYQYKFRLGEGDWWVLHEDSPIATDNIGNRNNLLIVSEQLRRESHIPLELLGTANMSSLNDGTGNPKLEVDAEPEVKNEATIKDESTTAEPHVVLAGDKDAVEAIGHVEEDLDVVVPIPQPNNVGPEIGHKKEEATIEDEGTATGPPILLADEDGTIKDIKHEEPDLNGKANPVPEPETQEAEAQHKDEAAIKDEDTTSGHPIVLADGKGDVKAIKEPEPESTEDHANGTSSPALEVPVGPQQPEEEFGGHATVSSGDLLKTPNSGSEPDYHVISRSEARTPDLARVAAEVADSAEILDRETPTPELDDEEAGRTGLRRMSSTPIPEVAKTAAEVADSAAILDKQEDEVENKEAFKDVYKPDVKEEAKEDHKKEAFHIEIPTTQIIGIDGPETPGSGTVTPWEERAPRFSHECLTPPNGDLRPASREHDEYEGKGPRDPFENSPIDLNDPSIEEFPSEREAIFEHVRSCARRLSEDPTAVEGVPPSPVVGPNGHHERFELPSPNVLTINDQRSPSLLSIQEEDGDGFHKEELTTLPRSITQPKSEPDLKEAAAKDERETSVEVHEVSAESPPAGIIESSTHNFSEPQVNEHHISPGPVELPETPFGDDAGNNKQLDSEDGSPREIVSPKEGPSITVQPSTPGTSMKKRGSDTRSDPFDKVTKTTAIEEENSRAQLISRKRAPSPTPERPITPSSMRSAGKDAKGKNFLKTFLHLVFVEWIGGLIAKLCGGGRNTPMVIIALLVLTVAPYLYFSRNTGWIANRPFPHVPLDWKAGTPSFPPHAE